MSSIHYKFRSSVDYDTITFDGQAISLSDLRDAIMSQKKIAKSPAYTLEITNAQTKEVYEVDDTMVQKNSSVIVKRVPVQRLEAVTDQGSGLSKEEQELTEMALAKLSKTADLATAKASEEDKIKAMMKQSTEDFDPSTYQKRAPPNYICYRCGGKGHFVRFCPTQGDPRYNKQQFSRPPSGIPREYMIMKMRQEKELLDSLRSMQPTNTNFSPVVSSEIVDHTKVPSDLQCNICKKLFTDAVVTPCCGNSYCDDCIRNYLVEHDLVCLCGETTSPDNLIANRSLRNSVSNFRNQKTTEMKSVPPSPMTPPTQFNASSNGSTVKEEPRSDSPILPAISAVDHSEMNGALMNTNVPSPQLPMESLIDSPQRLIDRNDLSLSAATVPPVVQPGLPAMVPNSLSVSVPPMVNSSYVLSAGGGMPGGVYTNVAHTVRPAYHPTVIGQQQLMHQPTVVGSGLPYGLSLPPGATIVKRLVPVAVPGQRIITQAGVPNQIRLAHVQPQQVVQRAPVPVDLNHQRLVPGTAQNVGQVASTNSRNNVESPMPLTEDEFYKFQMKFKIRPTSRRRSRSKSPYRSRSRSPAPDKRKRRRHRSVSPNDSGKGRYDSPGEESSQERKSKKKKDKLRKRIRDSSQESVKGETKLKTRSSNDKKTSGGKSGRRIIPEHIKREVDEFEFDDELEFDEELRRLKSKSNRNESTNENEDDVSPPGANQQHSPSSETGEGSPSLSKQMSVDSPAVEGEATNSNQVSGSATDAVASVDTVDDVSMETSVKDLSTSSTTKNADSPQNVTSQADGKVLSQQTNGQEQKPKRKTKIIKKKVIRVIKVPRKKSKDGTPLAPSEGKIISQTIINKEDVSVKSSENTQDSSAIKRKTNEVKTDSPTKKIKIDSTNNEVKKRTSVSKVINNTPEKKKELLKKRQTVGKRTEKAKQLIAEVQAKKEAEKKELLERSKNTKPDDKKTKQSEEKRRKYERYVMLKKKAKEKAASDKQRKAQKAATSDGSENEHSTDSKSPTKKQSKTTVQREQKSSDEQSDGRKRPDQPFYKPGDAKLKSISELSKKELQESNDRKKSSRKGTDENGDVLKSKITSIKNVINSPEKRRMIKTSVSDEERDLKISQSSDEKSVRRVVKISSDKRSVKGSVVSRVERIDSRPSKDSKIRAGSVEKESRHSRHHDEEERRVKGAREREKEYERERRERKRLHLLEKEKEESMVREKHALREKERLERKLEHERQLRKEMEKEREDEERTRRKQQHDGEKRVKRKSRVAESESDEEEKRTSGKRSKKSKPPAIEVLDSDEEEEEKAVEEESSEEETEKKRKKKSKKRKEKKKKKKKEEESEDESEDSSDVEDEPKKKKKKKHKRKHKKRKSSRRHKKKSKKKKKKQEKSGSESSEDDEGETKENAEGVDDEDDDAVENTEENEESDSDSKSEPDTPQSTERKQSSSDKSDSATEKTANDDEGDASTTAEKRTKESSSATDEKSTKSSIKQNKKPSARSSKPTATTSTVSERKKRGTAGDADDLELDYDDVDIEDEDALLYGDLDFADDEQTNPQSVDELSKTKNDEEDRGEYEEGEIMDDELFTTTTAIATESSEPTVEEITTNDEEQTTGIDDDTELDDVINDAMNNIGLVSSSAADSENETVTKETNDKNENDDDR